MDERFRIKPQEQRVDEIISESGMITVGHFIYTSGNHGEQYINKGVLNLNPDMLSEIAKYLARPYQARNIDVVVGPAIGGITLSHEVAKHLSAFDNSSIPGLFSEESRRKENALEFRRGFEKRVVGQNVLIVEDTLNTGGAAKRTIQAVIDAGGNPIALSAIINRGGVTSDDVLGIPIKCLKEIPMVMWEPNECPLCKSGVPFNTDLGHAH